MKTFGPDVIFKFGPDVIFKQSYTYLHMIYQNIFSYASLQSSPRDVAGGGAS
jgi:hypothetical protein